MGAKIRKLTLSYPFAIDNRQQRTVFTVDDDSPNGGSSKVHTIQETYDEYFKAMKYQIYVKEGDSVKQWKSIVPSECTVEIEYYIK